MVGSPRSRTLQSFRELLSRPVQESCEGPDDPASRLSGLFVSRCTTFAFSSEGSKAGGAAWRPTEQARPLILAMQESCDSTASCQLDAQVEKDAQIEQLSGQNRSGVGFTFQGSSKPSELCARCSCVA